MLKKTGLAFLILTGAILGLEAQAQDEAAAQAPARISLKTDASLDNKTDKTNYIHYFCWQVIHAMGLEVASQTRCTGEKWMLKRLAPKKAAAGDEERPVALGLALDVDIEFVELTMEYDGKRAVTGYKWNGTIKGTISGADGKKIKAFDLKHRWGTNTSVTRKRAQTEYMRQMTHWILIELFESEPFQKLVPEDKQARLKKELADFKEKKKKLYDDAWSS